MYGGAVALGKALTETKAMEWLAGQVIAPDTPKLVLLMVIAVSTILLTEGISNAAAVAILLPIAYSLGEMTGIGPIMMTLAVTLTQLLLIALLLEIVKRHLPKIMANLSLVAICIYLAWRGVEPFVSVPGLVPGSIPGNLNFLQMTHLYPAITAVAILAANCHV